MRGFCNGINRDAAGRSVYFLFPANNGYINDRPAVNHGKYSSFSYADGRAELHKWVDVFLARNFNSTAPVKDNGWLAQHGTGHK